MEASVSTAVCEREQNTLSRSASSRFSIEQQRVASFVKLNQQSHFASKVKILCKQLNSSVRSFKIQP
jgi:hypothetical protein